MGGRATQTASLGHFKLGQQRLERRTENGRVLPVVRHCSPDFLHLLDPEVDSGIQVGQSCQGKNTREEEDGPVKVVCHIILERNHRETHNKGPWESAPILPTPNVPQ